MKGVSASKPRDADRILVLCTLSVLSTGLLILYSPALGQWLYVDDFQNQL